MSFEDSAFHRSTSFPCLFLSTYLQGDLHKVQGKERKKRQNRRENRVREGKRDEEQLGGCRERERETEREMRGTYVLFMFIEEEREEREEKTEIAEEK